MRASEIGEHLFFANVRYFIWWTRYLCVANHMASNNKRNCTHYTAANVRRARIQTFQYFRTAVPAYYTPHPHTHWLTHRPLYIITMTVRSFVQNDFRKLMWHIK